MMFPVMCLRTKDYTDKLQFQGNLSEKLYTADVKGYVTGIMRGDNSYTIQIRNARITLDSCGTRLKCGINIYSKEDSFVAGDYANLKVSLKDYSMPTNEGQFNSRKYYTSQGFIYCADVIEVIEVKRDNTYLSYVYRLSESVKIYIKKCILRIMPELCSQLCLETDQGLMMM